MAEADHPTAPVDPRRSRIEQLWPAVAEASAHGGIGVMVIGVDGSEYELVYENGVFGRLLGVTSELREARDFLRYLDPEDMPMVVDRMRRRLGGEELDDSVVLRLLRPDGARVVLEVFPSRQVQVDTRKIMVMFFTDITLRRETEVALRSSEERFRRVVENAPDPIGVIDGDHFVYVNPAMVALVGCASADDIVGVPIGRVLHPDDLPLMYERIAIWRDGGVPFGRAKYRVLRVDGSTATCELSACPIDWHGQPCFLGFARDVTSSEALADELVVATRLATVGTLAGALAHEINNPMQILSIGLERLEDIVPELVDERFPIAEVRDVLGDIRRAADRIGRVVRGIRSFTGVREAMPTRGADLQAVLDVVLAVAENDLRHRAKLVVQVPELPAAAIAAESLELVLVGLLHHAVVAIPEGASEPHLISISASADEERLYVEVSHDGLAISPPDRERMFDALFSHRGGGSGLGLWVCRQLALHAGGDIDVVARPDARTSFVVCLPLAPAAVPPPAPIAADPSAKRILIVDDEEMILRFLRVSFPGHEVVTAADADSAFRSLRDEPPFHLVLCDLMMPGTSGIDLFERVANELPGRERLFVFMTGGAFTPRAEAFLATVSNRCIEKPFAIGVVEALIEAAGSQA